ncbi:hypothetical protein [Geitlerinema sp. PCC 7407]|uniref:hypothetical protein n=1 Tax=Geitlerinema sp. PCC 7407 TaxID=1173025 RepID=UPI00031BC9DD|nr:hypothetical protein [Geitlerinema sp. PCC 7407]
MTPLIDGWGIDGEPKSFQKRDTQGNFGGQSLALGAVGLVVFQNALNWGSDRPLSEFSRGIFQNPLSRQFPKMKKLNVPTPLRTYF